jgi:hypothetical protein
MVLEPVISTELLDSHPKMKAVTEILVSVESFSGVV